MCNHSGDAASYLVGVDIVSYLIHAIPDFVLFVTTAW
jgi:hypothetical protein